MKWFKAGIFALASFLLLAMANMDGKTPKEAKAAHKKFSKQHSEFAHIPSGTMTVVPGSPLDISDEKTRKISVHSFYMSKYEVSNSQWRAYVKNLEANEGTKVANEALPDTSLWKSKPLVNQPMERYYYNHSAYANYPVVNITKEQAMDYCTWLKQQLLNDDNFLFDSVEVRLPTEIEWEYAARGGRDFNKYPWGGPYVRNAKGRYLANFLVIPTDGVKKDGDKLEVSLDRNELIADPQRIAAMIPAPVEMYYENGFGLYHMGGNVAEFVLDDRPDINALPKAFTRGGSFIDPPYYMKCDSRDYYDKGSSASVSRGFRPVIIVH